MLCEKCGDQMFREFEGEQIVYSCTRPRCAQLKKPGPDLHVVSSMAAVAGRTERYFRRVVLTGSYFAVDIDEDGNWHTYTSSVEAGQAHKDADTRAHHQAKDSIRYLRNQTDVS